MDTELNDAGGVGETDQTIEVNPADAATDEGYQPEAGDADASAAEPSYFDIDPYKDQLVRVKVDGEELEVPLAELTNGYMRQAAFTRKTQRLSEQAKQYSNAISVYEALQADPQAFLTTLAQAVGFNPAGNQSSEDEYVDPTESELRSVKAKLAELERFEQRRIFESEVARLTGKYGDVDVAEVVAHFANGGFPTLEAAYKDLAYESVLERQRELESKQKRNAEALAKKRAAAAVSSGSSPANGAVGADVTQVRTLREAYELAKRQLGRA